MKFPTKNYSIQTHIPQCVFMEACVHTHTHTTLTDKQAQCCHTTSPQGGVLTGSHVHKAQWQGTFIQCKSNIKLLKVFQLYKQIHPFISTHFLICRKKWKLYRILYPAQGSQVHTHTWVWENMQASRNIWLRQIGAASTKNLIKTLICVNGNSATCLFYNTSVFIFIFKE